MSFFPNKTTMQVLGVRTSPYLSGELSASHTARPRGLRPIQEERATAQLRRAVLELRREARAIVVWLRSQHLKVTVEMGR